MFEYFESLKDKKVLITGTSAGIGFSTAQVLCNLGAKVTGLSRRNPTEEIKSENYQHISGDLNDPQFRKEIESKGVFNCDILINNAGLALGKDEFADSKEEDIDLVLQTNINSSFKIVQGCLKSMLNQGIGDIINICSIASHEIYPGGVVYCASKHALLAMGQGLRKETHGKNIRVINISPGMVETEFSVVRFRGDSSKASDVYKGFTPLKPEDVAYQIVQALSCPRHVNLDEIIILATDQAGATQVKRNS